MARIVAAEELWPSIRQIQSLSITEGETSRAPSEEEEEGLDFNFDRGDSH